MDSLELAARLVKGIRQSERSLHDLNHQREARIAQLLKLIELASMFFHLAMRRGRKIAKVAMARKLAVHLYWMWRQGCDYGQLEKVGSHAGEPGHLDGGQ